MVKSCSAYNCTTRFTIHSELSFHVFPRDSEMRKKWVEATRRLNFTPTSSSVLCSKHFEPSCYVNGFGFTRLLNSAVPTVFDFTSKPAPQSSKKILKTDVIPAKRQMQKSKRLNEDFIVSESKKKTKKAEPSKMEITKKAEPSKMEITKKAEPSKMEITKKAEPSKMEITKSYKLDSETMIKETKERRARTRSSKLVNISLENVDTAETIPIVDIKIETDANIITDVIKNIISSLDLLVETDPDQIRSADVRDKIIAALYCYHQFIDDKKMLEGLYKGHKVPVNKKKVDLDHFDDEDVGLGDVSDIDYISDIDVNDIDDFERLKIVSAKDKLMRSKAKKKNKVGKEKKIEFQETFGNEEYLYEVEDDDVSLDDKANDDDENNYIIPDIDVNDIKIVDDFNEALKIMSEKDKPTCNKAKEKKKVDEKILKEFQETFGTEEYLSEEEDYVETPLRERYKTGESWPTNDDRNIVYIIS